MPREKEKSLKKRRLGLDKKKQQNEGPFVYQEIMSIIPVKQTKKHITKGKRATWSPPPIKPFLNLRAVHSYHGRAKETPLRVFLFDLPLIYEK